MAKVPGFAKVYAGRWAHRRNGHQATFAKAAEFFNTLLGLRLVSEPCEVSAGAPAAVPTAQNLASIPLSCA